MNDRDGADDNRMSVEDRAFVEPDEATIGIHELETHQVRAALGFAAYRTDSVRMASWELGTSTHIVATRRGLFGVWPTGFVQLTFGYFFGLTLRGNDLFAFESCDQPHGPTRQGRIVRFRIEGGRIVETEVVAKGLDNGCHQIDFVRGELHVMDTYNQQILRFSRDFRERATIRPLPVPPSGQWHKLAPQYRHANTLLAVGDLNLVVLHSGEPHTNGRSQLGVFDCNWKKLEFLTLRGTNCHGLALLEDGTLLCCGSEAGEIISAAGMRVKVTPLMSRGLAVGENSIVVGGSRFAPRGERLRTSGTISFLDGSYRQLAMIWLPGAATEIRRLDGQDRGLSSYLEEIGGSVTPKMESAE
jgi:hypothetical protein